MMRPEKRRIRRSSRFRAAWWSLTAVKHIDADHACGRSWCCACSACRAAREALGSAWCQAEAKKELKESTRDER